MLGPMLTTIHNLNYYLNLMQEVRAALEAGSFSSFQAQFKQARARGV
jgi:queuine tRNA-ribosyltransferase